MARARDPGRRLAVTSSGQAGRYPGGRPRDPQVDAAITRSALELLIERGAAATSIEQVAQRAKVTKATVYRRFAGKTELLVHTVAAVFEPPKRGGLEWRSLEQMVTDWAEFLSRPNIGRVLRRLYSSAEEYPDLLEVYWDRHGRHHWAAVQSTLKQARDQGQLAEDAQIDVIQEILFGTVLYQLVAGHQAPDARQIDTSLNAVLRQVGYHTGARRAL